MLPSAYLDDHEVLTRRLGEFLAARGATPEMVLSAVVDAYGKPLLVVASGSVLHGFGNERSDLDLNVVVEGEKLSGLSLVSHEHGFLNDTTYFSEAEVENWLPALRDRQWPPHGRLDRDGWRRALGQLFNCSRFGDGLMLSWRDGWDRWVLALRESWLLERLAQWWRIEALRWWVGGRWLSTAKPLLSAQRHCDAVLAALESRVAAAGQFYFGAKWLPEKLRLLGDIEGLGTFEAALRAPSTEREAVTYASQCEAVLKELLGALEDHSGLAAQLTYAPGVTVRGMSSSTLVTRWDLRGIELRQPALPAVDAEEPLWEGPLGTLPDPDLHTLFVEDMTWLSVVARGRVRGSTGE